MPKDGRMCVELGKVGELGELGHMVEGVEGEVQNHMPNCMR